VADLTVTCLCHLSAHRNEGDAGVDEISIDQSVLFGRRDQC